MRKLIKITSYIKYMCMSTFFFLLGFSCQVMADDQGVDVLAKTSLKANTQATFGPDSTIAVIIYVIEVVLGLFGYATTKNPKFLIGIVILVLASAGMFSLAGM